MQTLNLETFNSEIFNFENFQLRNFETKYASKVGTDISGAVGNTDLPYAVFATTLSVLQNRVVVGPSFSANFLAAR